MKGTIYIINLLVATLLLAACSEEDLFFEEQGKVHQTPLTPTDDEDDMPVRIGYLLTNENLKVGDKPETRASSTNTSVVGGEEGYLNTTNNKTNLVKSIHMLCFTVEGIYLGYRQATLNDDEIMLNDEVKQGDQVVILGQHPGRYLFEGKVPSRTARIHFVANVDDSKLPSNEDFSINENLIIKSKRMSMTLSDRAISYWGFHGEASPEDMRNWLATIKKTVTVEENGVSHVYDIENEQVTFTYGGETKTYRVVDNRLYYMEGTELRETEWTVDISYEKKEDSVVHLIRDRAKVEFGHMDDFYRATDVIITENGESRNLLENKSTDYKILSISWILVNGLDRGYIAPYNENNSEDHFRDYYNDANRTLDENRQTPYDKDDRRRYSTVSEDTGVLASKMMEVFRASGTDGNTNAVSWSDRGEDFPLFLFEDENDQMNPPKIILKVDYLKNRNSYVTGQNNISNYDPSLCETKYHTLMMMDQNGNICKILRNHSYVLNISGLPWEGLGHLNFEDAVNSVDYANNRTVTIDEEVTEVTNGDFRLQIEKTALVVNDPNQAGQTMTVNFAFDAVGVEADLTNINAESFQLTWETNDPTDISSGNPVVTSYVKNGKLGTGTIQFTLFPSITNNLRKGVITLREKSTSMVRYINVYGITAFRASPTALVRSNDNLSSITLIEDEDKPENEQTILNYGTGYRSIGKENDKVSCNTYKFSFTIPGDYPSDLYPIRVRMASSTLNPFLCEVDGHYSNTINVVTDGTENGTVLNGETLTGMNFTTASADAKKWNYHNFGEPWNYWYVYTIMTKPTIVVEGETIDDEQDKTYTIYFDDTRPLRAAANRADDVGLFFKIKYFGPATSVTVQ